jgi:SSS family solute:Na+ symporter
MGVLLSLNIIFTYLGGYLTLVVTNFFHMILTLGVLYVVLFLVVARTGIQRTWSSLEQAKGLGGVYPFAGDASSYGWVWFLWLVTMSILLQFSYGPYLQKYATMDRPKTVSRSYLIGSLCGNGRTFAIMGLGVVALAVLGTAAPASAGVSDHVWATMAAPYYLSLAVPPVLMGFLLVGLVCADTSTTDQYLLSWSTSIVNDCICPFRSKPFSVRQHLTVIRITIVVLCLIFFIFGLVYRPTLPLWEYLWLCGNIIGGTGVAVLFGMYWKRATTAGAYTAVFTCLVLPMLDLVVRRMYVAWWPNAVYPLKPETTGLATYVLAMVLLVLVSLGSHAPTKYQDLGLLVRKMNQEVR